LFQLVLLFTMFRTTILYLLILWAYCSAQNSGEIANSLQQQCHSLAGACRDSGASDCETRLQRCLSEIDRGNRDSSWPQTAFGPATRPSQPPSQNTNRPAVNNPPVNTVPVTPSPQPDPDPVATQPAPVRPILAPPIAKADVSSKQNKPTNDTATNGTLGNATIVGNANDPNGQSAPSGKSGEFGPQSSNNNALIIPIALSVSGIAILGLAVFGAYRYTVWKRMASTRAQIERNMERAFYPGHIQ
jgi:hypothetical protein